MDFSAYNTHILCLTGARVKHVRLRDYRYVFFKIASPHHRHSSRVIIVCRVGAVREGDGGVRGAGEGGQGGGGGPAPPAQDPQEQHGPSHAHRRQGRQR